MKNKDYKQALEKIKVSLYSVGAYKAHNAVKDAIKYSLDIINEVLKDE